MSTLKTGDVKVTADQIPALARGLAEAVIMTLDGTWEILEHCGVGWRETMVNSVSAEIQKRLVALAVQAPAPKPTATQIADAVTPAGKKCPKCSTILPAGAYCKSFDCPMNPSEPKPVSDVLNRRFVSVTPPQGGLGATHKL